MRDSITRLRELNRRKDSQEENKQHDSPPATTNSVRGGYWWTPFETGTELHIDLDKLTQIATDKRTSDANRLARTLFWIR